MDLVELMTSHKQCLQVYLIGTKVKSCLIAVLRFVFGSYLINYRHWLAKQLTCLLVRVKINFSFKSEKTKGSQCISQQIGMECIKQSGWDNSFYLESKQSSSLYQWMNECFTSFTSHFKVAYTIFKFWKRITTKFHQLFLSLQEIQDLVKRQVFAMLVFTKLTVCFCVFFTVFPTTH